MKDDENRGVTFLNVEQCWVTDRSIKAIATKCDGQFAAMALIDSSV